MKILAVGFIIAVLAACNSANNATNLQDIAKTNNSLIPPDTLPPMDTIPKGAKIIFKNLKEGQTIASPLNAEFSVSGINLNSIATGNNHSGHCHLLIDAGDSIPSKMIIAEDSTHLRFNSTQTRTQIKLLQGKHKLALQYGDAYNRSYGEKLATSVNIVIK